MVDKIAHDTNLQYVRCCTKCADTVDQGLKSRLRGKFDEEDSISV